MCVCVSTYAMFVRVCVYVHTCMCVMGERQSAQETVERRSHRHRASAGLSGRSQIRVEASKSPLTERDGQGPDRGAESIQKHENLGTSRLCYAFHSRQH